MTDTPAPQLVARAQRIRELRAKYGTLPFGDALTYGEAQEVFDAAEILAAGVRSSNAGAAPPLTGERLREVLTKLLWDYEARESAGLDVETLAPWLAAWLLPKLGGVVLPREAAPTLSSWWLIERPQDQQPATWWTGNPQRWLVPDANEAIRFRSKADAEAVLRLLGREVDYLIVTEHMWGSLPREADTAPPLSEDVLRAARVVVEHPVRCGGAYCGDPDCDAVADLRAALRGPQRPEGT